MLAVDVVYTRRLHRGLYDLLCAANGDGATCQELPTMSRRMGRHRLERPESTVRVFNGRTLATPRARLILVMGVSAAVVLVVRISKSPL